jgi:3-hydroxyisobutyrate dehydrogenase
VTVAAVGYVGLGAMGGALAQNLLAGFDLHVLDRNPAALAAFAARGATAAPDGVTLARACDVVILCLPRSSDVREALFGASGLADGLAPGALVIDQTSGIPGQTAEMAEVLARRGILMVDAPVSGGVPAAAAGKVTIIASGPDAAWERGEFILRALSDKVFRCSDRVGDGQALKLVNNAIGMGFRVNALELVALGRKAGLGLAAMVDHLNAGLAANFTTRNMLAGLVEGRSTTNFALSLMAKDLSEAMALGLATQVGMPFTGATRGTVQTGLAVLARRRQAGRDH